MGASNDASAFMRHLTMPFYILLYMINYLCHIGVLV